MCVCDRCHGGVENVADDYDADGDDVALAPLKTTIMKTDPHGESSPTLSMNTHHSFEACR